MMDDDLLMLSLPHQRQVLQRPASSGSASSRRWRTGCTPSLHGYACPEIGSSWILLEHTKPARFLHSSAPRPEMLSDIRTAVEADLDYHLPAHYARGAGDTYFSAKMLAKLGRILLVAEAIGDVDKDQFNDALNRLKAGLEVWLNGSAATPFIYDATWHGIVGCGCYMDNNMTQCISRYPYCPALVDMGNNFGAGFYNDHHFHYGYFIHAAAVAAHLDPAWGLRYHEAVLLLIRDIANPSPWDPYFPTWRHKDW